jgi:hypothetical protein
MKTIELIDPETGDRRMVPTEGHSAENRIACLKRAGFVPAATYRAPKKKVEEPEPTLAEKVEEAAVKVEVDGVELEAEIAVHGEGEPLPEGDEGFSTPEYGAGEPESDPEPEKEPEPEDDEKVEPEPEEEKPARKSRKKKS